MKPVIVVVAYNRVKSIRRLLTSLAIASYEEFEGEIKLIVSIDYSGSNEVLSEVQRFKWAHGDFQIIKHKKNLGLKQHVIKCGDLTKLYGSIILLEDDLFVAPGFYKYAVSALMFYAKEKYVGGISLYRHLYNESAGMSFVPMEDNYDVYFLQIASSWGQAWSSEQWCGFREWYDEGQEISKDDCLPNDVLLWPDTSWKKYFIKYLVKKDKYFIYPKKSFTTNFGDSGVHQVRNNLFQVPLFMGNKKNNFISFDKSMSIYDSFCELLPSVYKKLNSDLECYDFESDLYGTKETSKINSPYVLTTKESIVGENVKSYGLLMKPMELNVVFNINGNFFNLIKLKKGDKLIKRSIKNLMFYEYFYKPIKRNSLKLFFLKGLMKLFKL